MNVLPRARFAPHVVITGASSGLGAALAAQYAARHARLSLMGRNRDRLEAVQALAAKTGGRAECFYGDVRESESMRETLIRIDDNQAVTLIIANAGIGGAYALSTREGELASVARNLISTNVLGVINTITPLLPRLIARRHGHIVIIGSIAGFTALPETPAYCASKAAVHIYGTALRRNLLGSGVDVTVVSPGFIATPMSASLPTPTPFLAPAERAASRIVQAIDKRKRELSFPWPLTWAARLDRWLPPSIGDRMMTALVSRMEARW
ncbi:MAG: SDR family NAD(P)-dependent oxidoreductase [Hyphomicrobiaceae bacterium]